MVDDAIVMLENIFRHMEQGEKPLAAALVGSKEIGFTIVSMTLSLAAVFIPVLFMGGVLGRLFREFSVTICVAILISGIVSVTLTPMLCSRFLRAPGHDSHGRFYRATEAFFEWMLRVYDTTLKFCLQHRASTMFASLLVLAGTIWMFLVIPKGFIPDQDTNQIAGVTEAAQGTSFYQMINYQRAASAVIQQDPDVEAFMSTIGGTAATNLGGPNFGQLTVRLKPRNQRKRVREPDHRRTPSETGGDSGYQRLPAESAHHQSERPDHQKPVSDSPCNRPTSRSFTTTLSRCKI